MTFGKTINVYNDNCRICLFVLWFYVPLEFFSLIRSRHHYGWRDSICHLSLALRPIEHWVFFRVTHLCWHGACLYNGKPSSRRTRDTHLLTNVWQWSITTCFYDLGLTNALTDCATVAKAHLANCKEIIYRNSLIMFPIWSLGDKITIVQSLNKQKIKGTFLSNPLWIIPRNLWP